MKVAHVEFIEAKVFYEVEQPGLSKRFEKEIKDGIKRMKSFPNAWPIERPEIRRYILHKFPYKILYSIEKDYIYIIAIAHCHRKPNYWIDRILEES